MKGKTLVWIKTLAALYLAFSLAACVALVAGGAIGAGGVIYVNGELTHTVNRPVPKVYAATIATLKDMNLPVLEDTHDQLSARIKSKLATGEDINISLNSASAETTKIGVRVGVVGDKDKSQTILSNIESHLK